MGYGAMSTLYVLTAGVALALIFSGFLSYARDYIITYITTTIEARLTGDLFDKMLELPVDKFVVGRPDLIEKGVRGSSEARTFINRKILNNIFDATAILVFLPVLYGYSPVIAYLVFGFGLVGGFLTLYMDKVEETMGVELSAQEICGSHALADH